MTWNLLWILAGTLGFVALAIGIGYLMSRPHRPDDGPLVRTGSGGSYNQDAFAALHRALGPNGIDESAICEARGLYDPLPPVRTFVECANCGAFHPDDTDCECSR